MASGSKKVIYAALVGNALIAVTKFVAAALTGSSAMLSEGIHSVVDTGNQVLLLYGLRRARRTADERFPFGHGKEIYFWSFVVAILIFAVGSGVSHLRGRPARRDAARACHDPIVNYVVLALAMVFEGLAWYVALREFRRTKGPWGYIEAVQRGKDPTLFVVLFEDSAAMLGLVVAFLGIGLSQLTGLHVFDALRLDRHRPDPRRHRGLARVRDQGAAHRRERQPRAWLTASASSRGRWSTSSTSTRCSRCTWGPSSSSST